MFANGRKRCCKASLFLPVGFACRVRPRGSGYCSKQGNEKERREEACACSSCADSEVLIHVSHENNAWVSRPVGQEVSSPLARIAGPAPTSILLHFSIHSTQRRSRLLLCLWSVVLRNIFLTAILTRRREATVLATLGLA